MNFYKCCDLTEKVYLACSGTEQGSAGDFNPKSRWVVEAAAGEHSGGGGAQRPDYKTHELFAQKNDD